MRPIRVAGRCLGRFRLRGGHWGRRRSEARASRGTPAMGRLVSACRQVLSALAGRSCRRLPAGPVATGSFAESARGRCARSRFDRPGNCPSMFGALGATGIQGHHSTGTKIADSAQYTQAMSRTHSTAGGGGGRRAADPGQEAQDVHPAPAWSTTIPIPRDLDGSMARLRVWTARFGSRDVIGFLLGRKFVGSWRVAPVRTQHDVQPCCARAGSPGSALGWPNVCIGKSAYSMVDLS